MTGDEATPQPREPREEDLSYLESSEAVPLDLEGSTAAP
jgi:hypothetical protein